MSVANTRTSTLVPVNQAERLAALHADREREARFLTAWKRAVRIAGANYFDVINTHFYEFATKKDQLRPSYPKIKTALATESIQQGLFLCALYTFYNEDEGRRLTEQFYPSCGSRETLMRQLDPERREVLQNLVASYTDWW
jgi:hypothetical protein